MSNVADIRQSFETEWAFEESNAQPSTELFDNSSLAFELVNDTVGVEETIADSAAKMGTQDDYIERSRIVGEVVSGQHTYDVSPAVLDFFLKMITGASASPYTPQAGSYCDFDYMRDEPGTTWLFRNCVISQATFSPGPNDLIRMVLDVQGRVGSKDATFANAASQSDIHDEAYSNHEYAINIASGIRYVNQWELTIVTGIELEAQQNLTPNRARAGKRSVTFNADVEWSSANEAALYGQGKSGLAATLTFARENMSTVFTMPNLVLPKSPVPINDGDIRWNFSGTSKASLAGGTGIYSITHDSNNAA